MRRRTALRQSFGTRWPVDVLRELRSRDPVCVGRVVGLPGDCVGELQPDHVRASGGLGMKSDSVVSNGAMLCASHHRYKTEHGRDVRPVLIDYIDRKMA